MTYFGIAICFTFLCGCGLVFGAASQASMEIAFNAVLVFICCALQAIIWGLLSFTRPKG